MIVTKQIERIVYPDGQISVKLKHSHDYPLDVHERINSYADLFAVRSIAEAAHYQGIKLGTLTIPCLFGQRSDRRFEGSQSFDLGLIADVINDCGFKRVVIFDPHSDVSLALIKNSEKLSPLGYVRDAWAAEFGAHIEANKHLPIEDKYKPIIVSPDAGAYKKAFDIGKELNCPIVAGLKHRDLKGNIELQFSGDVYDKNCLIVDDLADGGYTFELLAKELRKASCCNIALYVSHGYFNKGFDNLFASGIDRIYCTNSVKDIEHEKVTQFKVI